MQHQMAVVVREAFRDPETARGEWTREVPRSKFFWTQSLDVPNVKEFMGHCAECALIRTGIPERAGLDDLSRGEMFHAVAGVIVGGEVNQKRVLLKLRRAPHCHLCAHDLLDVLHERRPLAAFGTERVDHHMKLLAVDYEIVPRPVGRDLCWRVNHDVPVWKLPLSLAATVSASVNDLPTRRRVDLELHRIGFMAHDVHEYRAAVVIGMTLVQL